MRQADPCVSGSALDDGAALCYLCVAHQVQRGAVLDAPAGIHELVLGEDAAASVPADLREQREGRPADGAREPA